jgi:hypothetical protein
MVSGSGPTVVGLWWGERARSSAEEAARGLRTHYPRAQPADPVDPSVGVPAVV